MNTTCLICHHDYNSWIYPACPYCSGMSTEPGRTAPGRPEAAMTRTAKPYLICPNCGNSNQRTDHHCSKCNAPLPIYDEKMEGRMVDDQIIKAMTLDDKKDFLILAARMNLVYLLQIFKENQACPKCGYRPLKFVDDDCPSCHTPILRYKCDKCKGELTTRDLLCPVCHAPTFLRYLLDCLSGSVRSNASVEKELRILGQIYNFDPIKRAFPSFLFFQEIVEAKIQLEQVVGENAERFEVLSNVLTDFMINDTRPFDLPNANEALARNMQPFNLTGIKTPTPTQHIADLIQKQVEAAAADDGSGGAGPGPATPDPGAATMMPPGNPGAPGAASVIQQRRPPKAPADPDEIDDPWGGTL